MNSSTNIKDNGYYTNTVYYKPDKLCPHCGEVIEKGTDLNKYISIKINCVELEKKRQRFEFNRRKP